LGSAPAPGAVGRALAARPVHQVRSLLGALVHAVFGARAHRTAAEAAALPIHFNCIVAA